MFVKKKCKKLLNISEKSSIFDEILFKKISISYEN